MMQLSNVSHYPKYINWLIDIGERNHWEIDEQKNRPVDYSVSQSYLSVYEHPHLRNDKIIVPTQAKTKALLDSSSVNEHHCKSSKSLFLKPSIFAKFSKITKDTTNVYLAYLNS